MTDKNSYSKELAAHAAIRNIVEKHDISDFNFQEIANIRDQSANIIERLHCMLAPYV